MSCFNESVAVNKLDDLVEAQSLVKTVAACGSCAMLYNEYKQLLEHLYWRHGTEGARCEACGIKRWRFAPHVCHVLPINDSVDDKGFAPERESDYCLCGQYLEDSPMIGCDSPHCPLQWYHFQCVGVDSPPDGEWFCPQCSKVKTMIKKRHKNVKT